MAWAGHVTYRDKHRLVSRTGGGRGKARGEIEREGGGEGERERGGRGQVEREGGIQEYREGKIGEEREKEREKKR